MKWWEIVLEIIKVTTPALIVFLTVYFLMKEYFKKEYNMRVMEQRQETRETVIPLKLQAYERLTLLCERIRIENLLTRLASISPDPNLLKSSLIIAIHQEFEHNISQQVYVSGSLWKIIGLAKNQTINIITKTGENLPKDATSEDFRMILIHQLSNIENPLDTAIMAIKKEAGILLG